MQVQRCVCSAITFLEIQKIARKEGYETVEELQQNGICARHCKLCEPYIRKMFDTGRTSFHPGDVHHSDYS